MPTINADHGVATFCRGVGGHMECADNSPTDPLQFDRNFTIVPTNTRPPAIVTVKLSAEKARALTRDRLRMVIIVSFQGLRPPVLNAVPGLDDGTLKQLDDTLNQHQWNAAWERFEANTITLRARVERVILYDRDKDGIAHPLWSWQGG